MKPNHSEQRKRSILRDRPVVLAISVLVLILGLVGTTLGFLVDQTSEIKNTFQSAKAKITVVEDITTSGVKNSVKIKNESDKFPVFIRARVIVTWKDDAGNVSATAPVEGTDYTLTWTKENYWVKHTDGNYYYTNSVDVGDSTGILFTDCKPVDGKAPEGYHLSVEIIADCIQSYPADAVEEAWGIRVNSTVQNGSGTLKVGNGKLVPVTASEGGND